MKPYLAVSAVLAIAAYSQPSLETKFNGGWAPSGARVGFSAHTILKRSDFGMGAGVPAPGTTLGVSDAVEVSIETEFSRGATTAETPD